MRLAFNLERRRFAFKFPVDQALYPFMRIAEQELTGLNQQNFFVLGELTSDSNPWNEQKVAALMAREFDRRVLWQLLEAL